MAVTIRKNDIRASNLYFLSWAFSIGAMLLHPPAIPQKANIGYVFMYVFAGLFSLALGFGIRAGYRWIKIVFAVIGALGVINYLIHLPYPNEPLGKTILFLLASAAQGWAVVIVLKDLFTQKPAAVGQPEQPVAGEAADAGAARGQSN